MRWEALAYKSFCSLLYMQYRDLLFSTQYEKHTSETEHKGLYQFYWETLIFIAIDFTWVKTEGWIHDVTEAHNEMGFGACRKYRHDWGYVSKTATHFNLLPFKQNRCQPLLTYGAADPWVPYSSLNNQHSGLVPPLANTLVAWRQRFEIRRISIQQIRFSSVHLLKSLHIVADWFIFIMIKDLH